MAIYHLTASTGSRTGGQSAAAKFAYICREGKYARAYEPVRVESGNMPAWAANDPARYWAAADAHERSNGRLFKHLEAAIPCELTPERKIALARQFAHQVATTPAGPLPFTLAIHDLHGHNPHVHIEVSERVNDNVARTADTWFKRAGRGAAGGAKKTDALKPQEWLLETRARWARLANIGLKHEGHADRIDHRSYAEREIDRAPGIHLGAAHAMEARGVQTERGDLYRRAFELNTDLEATKQELQAARIAQDYVEAHEWAQEQAWAEFEALEASWRDAAAKEALTKKLEAPALDLVPQKEPSLDDLARAAIKARAEAAAAIKVRGEAQAAKNNAEKEAVGQPFTLARRWSKVQKENAVVTAVETEEKAVAQYRKTTQDYASKAIDDHLVTGTDEGQQRALQALKMVAQAHGGGRDGVAKADALLDSRRGSGGEAWDKLKAAWDDFAERMRKVLGIGQGINKGRGE